MITDTKARNIKPGDPALAHGGVTGLVLIPSSKKGHGKWVIRFTSPITGKRRNAGMGTYPEISIAEIGKVGIQFRELLAAGKDPLEEKKQVSEQPQVPDFRTAAEILHKELLPGWGNKKHAQQWINTITTFAVPVIGDLLLSQIEPKHIADVLRPIWLTKPETAGRLKQRIHAVLAWGWAHGHCNSNPVDVVHHLLPQQPGKSVRTTHQPAMPWREVPLLFRDHLSDNDPADITRRMLEVLILTAVRSGEVRGMRWDEIDLPNKIWTIPAGRMKAKQPHRVPLTPRTIQILEQLKGKHDELVFPSVRDQVMLSDMVLTAFLRRIKATSETPGRYATAHGFRSSFRDWCSENAVPRDLAERALAHTVQNRVEAAYHRTDLLDQRRPVMLDWERHCLSMLTMVDKVVIINGRTIVSRARKERVFVPPHTKAGKTGTI